MTNEILKESLLSLLKEYAICVEGDNEIAVAYSDEYNFKTKPVNCFTDERDDISVMGYYYLLKCALASRAALNSLSGVQFGKSSLLASSLPMW